MAQARQAFSALPKTINSDAEFKDVYSDHMPQLSAIPLGDDHVMKVVTYNLGLSGPLLFVDSTGTMVKPTEEQKNAQKARVLESIKAIATAQQPDLIALQEAFPQEIDQTVEAQHGFLDRIVASLPEGWDYTNSSDYRLNGKPNVILFNTKVLNLAEVSAQPLACGDATVCAELASSVQSAKFTHIPTQQEFHVHNVHLDYSDTAAEAEVKINTIFRYYQEPMNIVLGDTNARFPDIRSPLQHNGTNTNPLEQNGSGYDYTDAVLIQGSDGSIQQMPGDVLDPSTGQIIPRELVPFSEAATDTHYKVPAYQENHLFEFNDKQYAFSRVALALKTALALQDADDIRLAKNLYNYPVITIKSAQKVTALEGNGIGAVQSSSSDSPRYWYSLYPLSAEHREFIMGWIMPELESKADNSAPPSATCWNGPSLVLKILGGFTLGALLSGGIAGILLEASVLDAIMKASHVNIQLLESYHSHVVNFFLANNMSATAEAIAITTIVVAAELVVFALIGIGFCLYHCLTRNQKNTNDEAKSEGDGATLDDEAAKGMLTA